ncbi:MAG: glutamate 5-kinase [Thiohalomonadaceae bacterium]
MSSREQLGQSQRWVVKIGSALLTNEGRGLNRESIADWVAQMARLCGRGVELVLVSSGAVAEGMTRLGWKKRPNALNELQAAAAVGQMGLVQTWESSFQSHGRHTAQVLLTHDDLSNRGRYLNARSTLRTLVGLGVIPVINENDTVVTEEIRFGDNDTLGALVANLVQADLLVILTDQAGLFDKDPRHHADAQLVPEARANDARLDAMVGGAGTLGRGGMITKLRAARLAARSGAATIIAPGRSAGVLDSIAAGAPIGTLLLPDRESEAARKQWIAGHLQMKGRLVIDAGAVRVLREQGRSLLPVGVKAVEGQFLRGEMVACVDEAGKEVARGLVNYGAADVCRIMGQPSSRILEILGFEGEPELIHRDDLVIL